MKKFVKIIGLIILVTLAIGIYSTYIERNLLVVKEKNINLNKGGSNSENIKIVQITDTQLGEFYNLEDLEKVVKKINTLNPDIVVFTGDLIDNASKYKDLNKVSDALAQIKCKVGKYAIYGNHDYGGGAVRYYSDIMNKAGFTVLKNDSVSIDFKGKKINIFGGDDALMGNHNAEKTMEKVNKDETNILLLHEPDLIDKYKNYPIDLALAGHSHGGQVYIPFYGPIKKNELAKKYSKGMYQINNSFKTSLYVSSGLGNTKVPFRLFNIPEIVVFNIGI